VSSSLSLPVQQWKADFFELAFFILAKQMEVLFHLGFRASNGKLVPSFAPAAENPIVVYMLDWTGDESGLLFWPRN
tara:strand:- start:47 stop:274 length:228 start_codon:yes stop_codon:yes gene_type:complete